VEQVFKLGTNKEMNLREFQKQMEELGRMWLKGDKITEYKIGDKVLRLNKKQIQFLNSKKKYCLIYGGFGSGKSVILYIKMILFSLMFPGNMILLGRKHLSDIELTILPDLKDLMHPKWYHHRIRQGLIEFFNGSKIILFGLDALQEGALADIKKAQQKIKSLNLGAFFIDQLEEIEKDVFLSLTHRLRRKEVPLRQGNMTTNPANYWAYEYFLTNPPKGIDIDVIQTSMLDNKENLPEDYIQEQMSRDEKYVRRYVYGEWTMDVMTDMLVFPEEYIKRFKPRKPLKIEEGCEIYREYERGVKYHMGVDPSEGAVDPSSISVVSEDGEKVAKFNGKIPIHALGEKVKFLYYKYHEPLIIPEVNNAGQALLLQIRDLKLYRRKIYDQKVDKETEKLGWKTNAQTKRALIDHFLDLLRNNFPQIYDKKTIEEFKTFVWSDEAKKQGAGALPHCHDDDVISTLLAYWGLSPIKKVERLMREEREKTLALQNKYRFEYR